MDTVFNLAKRRKIKNECQERCKDEVLKARSMAKALRSCLFYSEDD